MFIFRTRRKVAKWASRYSSFGLRFNDKEFRFAVHPEDWFLYELQKSNWQEWEISIINPCTKKGMNYLDIGSHVGVLAIIAAQNGSKVIALEPDLLSLTSLTANVIQNSVEDRVTVLSLALTNFTGMIPFGTLNDRGASTASVSSQNLTSRSLVGTINPIHLRELIGRDWVGLIKIDIEGEEWSIINQSDALTNHGTCPLLLSLHTTNLTSHDAAMILKKSLDFYQLFQTEFHGPTQVSSLDGECLQSGVILFMNSESSGI